MHRESRLFAIDGASVEGDDLFLDLDDYVSRGHPLIYVTHLANVKRRARWGRRENQRRVLPEYTAAMGISLISQDLNAAAFGKLRTHAPLIKEA